MSAPQLPPIPRTHTLADLLRSDLDALLSRKGVAPGTRPRTAWLRYLTNPSLQASGLLRIANYSPRWTHWLWRLVFVHRFSMDWLGPFELGPGVLLTHPLMVIITPGVKVGANVLISHDVGIGGNADHKAPVIEDGVQLMPGTLTIGDLTIGEGSIIGAGCRVYEDVPPHSVVKLERRQAVEPMRDSRWKRAGLAVEQDAAA